MQDGDKAMNEIIRKYYLLQINRVLIKSIKYLTLRTNCPMFDLKLYLFHLFECFLLCQLLIHSKK